jgi:AraC family transcriptional regulator of adaptative response/methylated-DNA-[protein]-cysteine methyltransferase
MQAAADEEFLYLLEFYDHSYLEQKLARLQFQTNKNIIPGKCSPIYQIDEELKKYFDGSLREFKTQLHLLGSHFQKLVWLELINIPYGQTKSYASQAMAIKRQKAVRAVANANGANNMAIVIPCHRVINTNGNLGGYGGGIARKKWLIEFEMANSEPFTHT